MENEIEKLMNTMSKANILMYKGLVVFSQLEKDTEKAKILENNDISIGQFKKISKKYKSFTGLRVSVLYDFFKIIDTIILKNKQIKKVNNDIVKTGGEQYIYNKDFCTKWFNNFDKNPDLPKKEIFGSFYDFGDSDYLLHINLASMNLHIGFVKYTKENELFKVVKSDDETISEMTKKISSIKLISDSFQLRKWGLKWLSIDCGSIINLVNIENFVTSVYFRNSEINKNILSPILVAIVK